MRNWRRESLQRAKGGQRGLHFGLVGSVLFQFIRAEVGNGGNMHKDVARNFVLQRPVAFAVLTGVVVVVTSLGAGLLLIRVHGGGWPWWFHGIVIIVVSVPGRPCLMAKLSPSTAMARRSSKTCVQRKLARAEQFIFLASGYPLDSPGHNT
jgi:hypothetical protein